MKTRKILSAVLAFVMLVIISGCSSEEAVKTNSEDEITEATKSNTVITETTTEATEATTVLSTKDGITLENAPKMREDIDMPPKYEKTINGVAYNVDPWVGDFFRKAGFTQGENMMNYDIINVTLNKDGIYLAGADYSGTIDGVEYTPEQKWDFIAAVEKKYPDYKFPYLEKLDDGQNVPTFALAIDGQNEIRLNINRPEGGDTAGTVLMNIEDMKNSILNCTYPKTKMNISGMAENSSISYSGMDVSLSELDFSNASRCRISVGLGVTAGMFAYNPSYDLKFSGGLDNTIKINLRNMDDSDGAVNIIAGGMLASKMVVNATNSKFNIIEDHDNPNFNSIIECNIPEITDFDNHDLQWQFCTNDKDNTPVYLRVPMGESERFAEIITGGELVPIPMSFPGNAPADGSVYALGRAVEQE
jgi:uncharacterized protein YcfL